MPRIASVRLVLPSDLIIHSPKEVKRHSSPSAPVPRIFCCVPSPFIEGMNQACLESICTCQLLTSPHKACICARKTKWSCANRFTTHQLTSQPDLRQHQVPKLLHGAIPVFCRDRSSIESNSAQRPIESIIDTENPRRGKTLRQEVVSFCSRSGTFSRIALNAAGFSL